MVEIGIERILVQLATVCTKCRTKRFSCRLDSDFSERSVLLWRLPLRAVQMPSSDFCSAFMRYASAAREFALIRWTLCRRFI